MVLDLGLGAGVGVHVSALLAHTGIVDAMGKDNIFPARHVLTASIEEAVARAQEWLE